MPVPQPAAPSVDRGGSVGVGPVGVLDADFAQPTAVGAAIAATADSTVESIPSIPTATAPPPPSSERGLSRWGTGSE